MITSRLPKSPVGGVGSLLTVVFMIGLTFYVLFCLMWNNSPFHPNPYNMLRFNRHDWLEDRSCADGSNRRGHMADDIMRHHLHRGMTEPQVIALLGTPDHTYTQANVQHRLNAYKQGGESEIYFKQSDLQAAKVDDYYLGEELSVVWGIDRAGLYLYMDSQGRYQGYRIHAP